MNQLSEPAPPHRRGGGAPRGAERPVRAVRAGVVGAYFSIAAVVAVVWLAGCARPAEPGAPGAGASGAPTSPPGGAGPTPTPPFGGCGDAVPAAFHTAGPVRMVSGLPARAPARHGNQLRGVVTLTNQGAAAVTGTTSVQPEIWVVRQGRVVATPAAMRLVAVRLDLAPGESRDFDTMVNLGRCVPGDRPTGDPGAATPLPPGAYELYAVQVITPALDSGRPASPAAAVLARGGPWPLTIG
ncbi:MAG TPA: hypothetical protein VNV66_12715 [Pilimelia sp.]|nr:hypothetical protein [Pilimelia sp.]